RRPQAASGAAQARGRAHSACCLSRDRRGRAGSAASPGQGNRRRATRRSEARGRAGVAAMKRPTTTGGDVIERGPDAKPPTKLSLKMPSLTDFRRIVVKVGSSLIVGASRVNEDWLAALAHDI